MVDRRMQRKTKKRIVKEEVPCIVYLSSNEESSFELAERKENSQLRYINELCKCSRTDSDEDSQEGLLWTCDTQQAVSGMSLSDETGEGQCAFGS